MPLLTFVIELDLTKAVQISYAKLRIIKNSASRCYSLKVGFVCSLFLFSKQLFIKKYTTRQQEVSINSREKKFIFAKWNIFSVFAAYHLRDKNFLEEIFKKRAKTSPQILLKMSINSEEIKLFCPFCGPLSKKLCNKIVNEFF